MKIDYLSQCNQNQQEKRTFDLTPKVGYRPIGFCVIVTTSKKIVRNLDVPEAVAFASGNGARVPDEWPKGPVMFLSYSEARENDIAKDVQTGPGRDFHTILSLTGVRNQALRIAARSRAQVDLPLAKATASLLPKKPALASVDRVALKKAIDEFLGSLTSFSNNPKALFLIPAST